MQIQPLLKVVLIGYFYLVGTTGCQHEAEQLPAFNPTELISKTATTMQEVTSFHYLIERSGATSLLRQR